MDAFSFLSFSLMLLLKMKEPPFRLATSFFLCLILLLITPFLVVHIYFLFFYLSSHHCQFRVLVISYSFLFFSRMEGGIVSKWRMYGLIACLMKGGSITRRKRLPHRNVQRLFFLFFSFVECLISFCFHFYFCLLGFILGPLQRPW